MEQKLVASNDFKVVHVHDIGVPEAEFEALYTEVFNSDVAELKNAKCPVRVPEAPVEPVD